jgi:hypothetical protein
VWEKPDLSGWVRIQVAGVVDSHAVMMFINTSDRSLFLPGRESTFNNAASLSSSFYMVGCVGSSLTLYDIYDAPANQVFMEAREGITPGEVDVSVVGIWSEGESVHTAQLDFSIIR